MLAAEACWVGDVLARLPTEDISPLLNVGSGTRVFRETVQPWIEYLIFSPLHERGVSVHHADIQRGEGIDLCGDLADENFIESLCASKYRALLCCNVLEHIADPVILASRLERIMAPGAYVVITVPHKFPYHPDPIDTMFRPGVAELAELFPRCDLIDGRLVRCGTGWDYVDRNLITMLSKVKRRLSGPAQHGGVKGTASFLPWLFREFKQTCVLLRRQS